MTPTMPALQPTITSRPEASALPLYAVVREDPFDPRPPRLVTVLPGQTLADIVDGLGLDPILRPYAVAVIDGEEVAEADWADVMVSDGCHVAICIAPQGGGDGGAKILTTVLTIFVMVAAFWVGGGALAGTLGSAFAAGSTGAYIAAGVVTAVGNLAISALVKPPSAPAQDRINPVYAIDGASNRFAPFEPISLSVGRRRVFPRSVARGFQEIIGDDFYYRLVVEWGPIGVALSDLKVGDTPLASLDGVEQQHRLVASDPHPTLYPAQVFQEAVGADLDSSLDWEMRRTIPNATEASIIIGWPTGLGHTSKKGDSESWGSQVEIRYRLVTGSPGSETFGPWLNPPGNGLASTRGSFTAGPGKYGFIEKKRNQPFFRAITFALPAAGLYEVEVRRSSENRDFEETRTVDDMTWQVIESRRPGQPVLRNDVAYSVFRFKGSGETQGRVDTLNAIVDRLIPRFDTGFLATGDLSTASAASLTSTGPSSSAWEIILWLYRNGFEGRRPLSDSEINWPSFAAAEKNRAAEGWTFDHVFEGAASIEEAVETIAYAACGRVAFIGNTLTAIVDAPQLAPVAVLSDRKVRNVRAVKRLSRPPDGFRVTFDDAADGYRTREVRVYVGGNTAETASQFEEIRVPGCVNWAPLHRLVQRNYRNSRLQNRVLTCEYPVHDVDTAIRLGAWVGIRTKVVEVGRASGWIRSVQTNGLGQVTGVTLDQVVELTETGSLVLQWSRSVAPGVSEQLSTAIPVASPPDDILSEQITFAAPVSGANAPQAGDAYVFGVAGFLRLDGLVDDIEAVDHDWLRLHLVDYAPARFEETGFTIPAYVPAYERPAFIRPPELELVSVATEMGQVVIHFRIKPGERGQAARFVAARAIAPDTGGTATGVWDALPDLAATERQLVAPGGQAGNVFIYRIAAVGPNGDLGPYLEIGPTAAIETLPAPALVTATGIVEDGVGGSRRPALLVTSDPNEETNITQLVVELRRVTLGLDDERVPEEDQPSFEPGAIGNPALGRAVVRGLPAGARLDVEVYYRGANQALSPRVRVEDVILPNTDIAGAAVDYAVGSALETAITGAVSAAGDALAEAISVRADFEAADDALMTAISARATIAALESAIADEASARVALGSAITAAYTAADAALGLEIDSRATLTELALVESNANSAISALNTTLSAEIDGVQGTVTTISGVLAQPSGSEALVAFRANTSSGVASLAVISTSGALGGGTRILLDAGNVIINGVSIQNNSITAAKMNVTSLSAITATIGLLRSAATGKRFEIDNNGFRFYNDAGVAQIEAAIV